MQATQGPPLGTITTPLAGAVREASETLDQLARALGAADHREPTVTAERLLLLAGPLLVALATIDGEARRLVAWLPAAGSPAPRASKS